MIGSRLFPFFFSRFKQRNAGNRLVPQCFSSSPPKGQSVAATKKTEVSVFRRFFFSSFICCDDRMNVRSFHA